ncbi:MAG: PaaI family thioesterase [Rhodospirillales bacterium]|jgi:uncharacterized protein (TIGR00369 family)
MSETHGPAGDGPADLSVAVGGFQRLVGYRLVRWEQDHAEVELDAAEQHGNRSGLLHGGVHATLLDSAAGLAGVFCAIPGNVIRATTLSFSVQFIAAARTGRIRAIGRRRGGGARIFFAAAEIRDAAGVLIASGEGSYRYIPGFEPPAGGRLDAEVTMRR